MSKIILITGASSGFGKAIAEKFAAGGWNIILTARRKEKLNAVASTLEEKFKVKRKHILYMTLLGIAGAIIIYIKIKQLGWLSYLISIIAGILIFPVGHSSAHRS